jgi:hypothetical protein
MNKIDSRSSCLSRTFVLFCYITATPSITTAIQCTIWLPPFFSIFSVSTEEGGGVERSNTAQIIGML